MRTRLASAPAGNRNPRSFTRPGVDGELIRQAPRAAQAETESSAGGVAVLQGEIEIDDAGALVREREPPAFADATFQYLDEPFAAAAVLERVARQLAGRRDELGLVDERETLRDGAFARELAHANHVFGAVDRLN